MWTWSIVKYNYSDNSNYNCRTSNHIPKEKKERLSTLGRVKVATLVVKMITDAFGSVVGTNKTSKVVVDPRHLKVEVTD